MRLNSAASAVCLAGLATLPLLAAVAWSGFHVRLVADPILSALSPMEQPLSVRTLAGLWALALPVAWFVLAYRGRNRAIWEAPLVLFGAVFAVVRTGNVWLEGVLLVLPLARQVRLLPLGGRTLAGLALALVALNAVTLVYSRPPGLPASAASAASTTTGAHVFADWQWASDLHRQLGGSRTVTGAAGLGAEPADFWTDYVRVSQGHARWSTILDSYGVDVVVLDASGTQQSLADLVRTSPGWRVVDDRDGALVAERIGAA